MAYDGTEDDLRNVRMWLEWIEDGSKSVPEVLRSVCNYLGAGTELYARHDNGVELVRLAMRCARMANDIPRPDAPARVKFLSVLDSLADRLRLNARFGGTYEAEREAQWARELYQCACADFTSVRYCNIYQIILDNWDSLKGWCGTYILLENVVCIQADWISIEAARDELITIIEEMASEW